jgi:hypothetical protein
VLPPVHVVECCVVCFLEKQQKAGIFLVQKNTGCIPWQWVLRAFGLRVSPCNSNCFFVTHLPTRWRWLARCTHHPLKDKKRVT